MCPSQLMSQVLEGRRFGALPSKVEGEPFTSMNASF